MLETIEQGKPATPFMRFGDRIRIEMLDAAGRSIYQGEVVVSAPSGGQVRVWRGASVTNMACSATCAPSIRGGEAVAPGAQTP